MLNFPQNWFQQLPSAAKLSGHKNIQILLSHPKVHSLMKDAEFQQIIRKKIFFKLINHPDFAKILQDSEI